MAITITKKPLSGANLGQPIGISATAGATYISIHTTLTGTSTIDELYLWAQNNYSQAVNLVLEWGTTATNAQIVTPIQPKDGLTVVIPGLIIQGSACTTLVTGYVDMNGSGSLAASSAFVTVTGWVNRITQS
jgi:hypothetical protein